jgi:hypothetical protein
MEDLEGLNFSTAPEPKSTPPNQTPFQQNQANYANPLPSRLGFSPNYMITPTSKSGSVPHTSGTTTANNQKLDSFASLSAFSGIARPGSLSNASMEQQRLAKEKEKREALEREKRSLNMHFDANEFWEKHSRQGTPSIATTDTYFHPSVPVTM